MQIAVCVLLALLWAAWLYPFIFRAPHNQKRPHVTLITSTRIGLFLECLAIGMALAVHVPFDAPVRAFRVLPMIALAGFSIAVACHAVKHLGKQFRVHAGLYEDHELVRTGPYAWVRHPIYFALLLMLLSTEFAVTRWPWALVPVAVLIAGTEIRVRTEDGLLASRFGAAFQQYRKQVSAYIPFVR